MRATILDCEMYTEAVAAVEEREQAASQQASALADRLPTASYTLEAQSLRADRRLRG